MSVKSVEGDDEGTFRAVLSAYDVVDLANEMTVKGCFDATIAEDGSERVMLWGHSQTDPIGQLELVDNQKSLSVKAKLCLATARGKEAYELLKQGVPLGMSIGYIVRKSHYNADGVRILDDVKLLEGSLTPTPCNQSCRVNLASVKSSDSMASKYEKLNFLKALDEDEREEAEKELDEFLAELDDDKSEDEEEEVPEEEPKSRKSKKAKKEEEPEEAPSEDDEKAFEACVARINALSKSLMG